MYRAQNIFGWSLFSPSVEVTTMSEPHATNLPVTEVFEANVKISWELPYSGGYNVPITGYKIMIKRKDGTFIEDTTNCNGVTDLTIVANKYCLVLMTALTSPTGYNL